MKKPEDKNKKIQQKKKLDSSIEELLNSIVMEHITKQVSYEKQAHAEYKESMETLVPILNEYLSNYVVIGHDVMGNEITFSFARSQNDKNAVSKLFHDVFIKYMMQQQTGGLF